MSRTIIGQTLVTLLILAVTYAIVWPAITRFRWNMRYGGEINQLKKVFGAVSLYAGQNDDRFPSSISDYDSFLIRSGKSPTDSVATNYGWLPGTCSVLGETAGNDICASNLDQLPDIAQPADGKMHVSWKGMTGASFNTSSRFGLYHVSLNTTWGCPVMPMFWTHPYRDEGDEPLRVTYFSGETKFVPSSEFTDQLSCLQHSIVSR